MNALEIMEAAQYVVDQNGHRTAVLLDLARWQKLQNLLEELAEDERLGQLMDMARDEKKLTGEEALKTYREFLVEMG